MILAWPALVAVAAALAWSRRATAHGHGGRWFLAWVAAGFLISFSLVTGLSIGLLLLPLAAAALLWVARSSPHGLEATGFLAGAGATTVLVLLV
jgi:hypothetical protein